MLRKRQVNRRGVIGTPPPGNSKRNAQLIHLFCANLFQTVMIKLFTVRGRKHETIQTEKYLEELFARPLEFEAGCQTDLFLQRPLSPPYIPAKVGVDFATQIEEGDLFDFDMEVQPVLEVLIGKTIEQALVEVIHEEELAEMREQQQKIITSMDAEMAELKRLEESEKRVQGEKVIIIHFDMFVFNPSPKLLFFIHKGTSNNTRTRS